MLADLLSCMDFANFRTLIQNAGPQIRGRFDITYNRIRQIEQIFTAYAAKTHQRTLHSWKSWGVWVPAAAGIGPPRSGI